MSPAIPHLGESVRKLSSRLTYIYKVLFPTVWIGGFGLGTLFLVLNQQRFKGLTDSNNPTLVFLVVFVCVAPLLAWFARRLKYVVLDGADLVVSDMWHSIRVPLRDIERVSGSLLMSPELVWFKSRIPTEFGSTIIFIAPTRIRLLVGFTRNPMVEELRDLVKSTGSPVS